jgi:hypothetical protein
LITMVLLVDARLSEEGRLSSTLSSEVGSPRDFTTKTLNFGVRRLRI